MCVLSLSVCRCTSQDISVLTGSKCLSIVAYVFPPLGSIAVSIELTKKKKKKEIS